MDRFNDDELPTASRFRASGGSPECCSGKNGLPLRFVGRGIWFELAGVT
jgi:hypothetical protein